MGVSTSKKSAKKAADRSKLPSVPYEPTGLYETCVWSNRAVLRMITTKKIAPRYKGMEEEENGSQSECPICFLYYKEVNHVTCCNNDICTECYLQVKLPSGQSTCPFCSSPTLGAAYTPSITTPSPDLTPPRTTAIPLSSTSALASEDQVTSMSTSSNSSPPTSSPVVVSTAERQQLEHAMQSQRMSPDVLYDTPSTRSTSHSTGSRSSYTSGERGSNGSYRRNNGGRYRGSHSQSRERIRSRSTRSSRGISNISDNNDEEESYDMNFNVEQVEEMMMMEAIRLSMLETETVTKSFPPPPPLPSDSVKSSFHTNTADDDVKMDEDVKIGTTQGTVDSNSASILEEQMKSVSNEDDDGEDDDDEEDQRLLDLALNMSLELSSNPTPDSTSINLKIETPDNSHIVKNSKVSGDVVDGNQDFTSLSPSAKILMGKIDEALTNCVLNKNNGGIHDGSINKELFVGDDESSSVSNEELKCFQEPDTEVETPSRDSHFIGIGNISASIEGMCGVEENFDNNIEQSSLLENNIVTDHKSSDDAVLGSDKEKTHPEGGVLTTGMEKPIQYDNISEGMNTCVEENVNHVEFEVVTGHSTE